MESDLHLLDVPLDIKTNLCHKCKGANKPYLNIRVVFLLSIPQFVICINGPLDNHISNYIYGYPILGELWTFKFNYEYP